MFLSSIKNAPSGAFFVDLPMPRQAAASIHACSISVRSLMLLRNIAWASVAHLPHWSQAPRHLRNSRMLLTLSSNTALRIWWSVTLLQIQMYMG